MGFDSDTAGQAFGLVIAAGAATAIGAGVVFFPRIAHLANRTTLAISLGLSAGVMLYVSMVDIYSKAIGGFEENGHEEGDAFIYTSLCFFGGIIIMKLISVFTKCALGHDHDHEFDDVLLAQEMEQATAGEKVEEKNVDATPGASDEEEVEVVAPPAEETDSSDEEALAQQNGDDKKKKTSSDPLMKMGIATAIAIALHNFPEGLVTFVAYTQDPTLGIVLALGIALHNIPEGLCVAMPIYYATGNRWKAFLWGILSGVSEPLGALIGWVILGSSFSGNTYGILFGLVAGIMVFIAVDELLPTAHRYDPEGKYVTYSVFAGMFVLSLSLILFSI